MLEARKSLKATVITMIATLMILLSASGANAYVYNGGKWGSANITVYMYPMSSKSVSAWTAARDNWSQATDVNLYAGSPGSNITLNETYNANVTWDGIAYTSRSGGVFLSPANAYLNTRYTNGYTNIKTRGVAAHEIGHTIGLADVNYQTLMAGNTPLRGGIYYPTNDEITGINRLY